MPSLFLHRISVVLVYLYIAATTPDPAGRDPRHLETEPTFPRTTKTETLKDIGLEFLVSLVICTWTLPLAPAQQGRGKVSPSGFHGVAMAQRASLLLEPSYPHSYVWAIPQRSFYYSPGK